MSWKELWPYVPFACAISPNAILRKAMVTRVLEGLLIGVASAGLTTYVTVQRMEVSMITMKARLDEHLAWSAQQVATRNVELINSRKEILDAIKDVKGQVKTLNDCIITRSCRI